MKLSEHFTFCDFIVRVYSHFLFNIVPHSYIALNRCWFCKKKVSIVLIWRVYHSVSGLTALSPWHWRGDLCDRKIIRAQSNRRFCNWVSGAVRLIGHQYLPASQQHIIRKKGPKSPFKHESYMFLYILKLLKSKLFNSEGWVWGFKKCFYFIYIK